MEVGDLLECKRCRGTGTMFLGPDDEDRCDQCRIPGVRIDAPAGGSWDSLEGLAVAIEGGAACEVDGEVEHVEIALWLFTRWLAGRELTPAERWPETLKGAA